MDKDTSLPHSCSPLKTKTKNCLSLELLDQHLLQTSAVLGETSDTLVELVKRHNIFEKGPSELGLVVEVGSLGDGLASGRSVELLGEVVLRLVELIEELGGDGEEVATGKSGNFASVSERSTHDDGLVAVLLVVAGKGN